MACLDDFQKITVGAATVFHGSNLDVLPFMADNSVDSIVCDPPYELGFMGKSWDSSGIAYSVDLWRECLRVLKPGGHLLAFGGSRTWHRVAVAIEDAGFDLRDSIAWLYGSGFPKSHDVSKAIDKAAGVEREIVTDLVQDLFGEREVENSVTKKNTLARKTATGETLKGDRLMGQQMGVSTISQTLPATDDAKKWAGWGTALKPAFEPVVVARKPLVGTVAENVLTWGVGGLNIDGSRIGTDTERGTRYNGKPPLGGKTDYHGGGREDVWHVKAGRWPANIILDEYTAGLLPESGPTGNGKVSGFRNGGGDGNSVGLAGIKNAADGFSDSGSVSRFFYVAKASKRDRNEGLEELPDEMLTGRDAGQDAMQNAYKTRSKLTKNFHPTVKPTDLMRYLIKLVTPAGGIVLDPFTGSGSTGKAALLDGYQFVGIELTADYLPIIEGRLRWADQEHRDQIARLEAEEKETLF
jgi:site-specific DNA-methyltransferase (adenine-specific)